MYSPKVHRNVGNLSFVKVPLKALFLSAVSLFASPAMAEDLEAALRSAYETNPALMAARSALRATDELVSQALSNYRPSVSVNSSLGFATDDLEGPSENSSQSRSPLSIELNISQSLYRGGRTEAEVDRSEKSVLAQRALLRSTEQTVLLDAVTAYSDVWRDHAVVRLNRNNERVLERQLRAVEDRFEVGELTRTDVAQAESRLAQATAERVDAEGDLKSSLAAYEQVVGHLPISPDAVSQPRPFALMLPSRESLLAEALDNNPNIVAARFTEQAARDDIALIRGELYPELSLEGVVGYGDETSVEDTADSSASLIAKLSIPLYQQGDVHSRIRQTEHLASQRLDELEEQRRAVNQQAVSAWEQWESIKAQIRSLNAAIEAAQIALEGVRQEEKVGQRTVLDVLDAEQELLDSQVSMVVAQRDEVVVTFQILSALGRLSATEVGLDVPLYDDESYYQLARNR